MIGVFTLIVLIPTIVIPFAHLPEFTAIRRAPDTCMVESGNKFHVMFANGFFHFTDDVALWPRIGRVPRRVLRIPHRVTIVMLGNGPSKLGSRQIK